jgi:hypothetical protein
VYGFPYPLTLCVIHMAFCSVVSYVVVAVFKWVPLQTPIEHHVYLYSVVPIGALYALSLWCSNAAYLYLSVASIQMMKAFMPVSVRRSGGAQPHQPCEKRPSRVKAN